MLNAPAVITEGYRRIPKATEGNRRLPKDAEGLLKAAEG